MAYAALQDVYDLGFTARAFVVVPRPLDPRAGDSLDFASGTFRLGGHGFTATDLVWFVLVGAGSVPGSASTAVAYSPLPIDFFRFRLAASANGSALTYTSAGAGWALQIDPERRLQRHAEDATGRINECLTAYQTPLVVDPTTGRYPTQVVGICARMTARSAIPSLQFENAAFRAAADRVIAMERADDLTLADWKMGKPINPEATDQTTVPDDTAVATNGILRGTIADMPWMTGYL